MHRRLSRASRNPPQYLPAAGLHLVSTMNTPEIPDPDAQSAREDEPYRSVEAVLRSAGRPLTRSELREALSIGASETELFHSLVGREPFIEVDARHWGLIDRDVPSGESGFQLALDAIREADSKDAEQAYVAVQAISAEHASWSYEMAASAYRVYKSRALSCPRMMSGIRVREP